MRSPFWKLPFLIGKHWLNECLETGPQEVVTLLSLILDHFRLCRPRDLSYVHYHITLEVVFLSLLF
jgi:hypothetical protein